MTIRGKATPEDMLKFIRGYIASNNEAPTIAEIGRQFQMRSSASVHATLTALERQGKITRVPNISRNIRLTDEKEQIAVESPQYGDRRSSRRFYSDRRVAPRDRRRTYPGGGRSERGKALTPSPPPAWNRARPFFIVLVSCNVGAALGIFAGIAIARALWL